MVDAEKMKADGDATHALPPPGEPGFPVRFPAVKRHAPVLPPTPNEVVTPKGRFWRGAPAPLMIEQFRRRPDVRAIVTHPKRDIPHQDDVLALREPLHLPPLLEGEPLHVFIIPQILLELGSESGALL